MSPKARDRFERLLLALPHVDEDVPIGLDELARHVGTDGATLLGDLLALQGGDVDLPGHIPALTLSIAPSREHAETQVRGRSSHFRRPARLTRSELAALDLGLAMLRLDAAPEDQHDVAHVREVVRRATMSPVEATTPEPAAAERVASDGVIAVEPAPPQAATFFAQLQRAQEARRAVQIRYARAGASEASERIVHPYAIARADGLVYVVAWCTRAASLRIFRLDRIRAVTEDGAAFDVPDGFTLEGALVGGRLFLRDPHESTLVLRYSARIARWIGEREGVPPDADGTVTVRYPLADETWAVRHVLQYGPDVEVLAPTRVRDAVRETLVKLRA